MSKVKIIDKKSEKSVLFERQVLSRLRNSFIVNLIYSFQDSENLYLVMDYLKGGDLRFHICKNRNITENQTKFFLACLTLGLEFIHSHNLMHRDIKPENLLIDSIGYLRITDFGISSIYKKNKRNANDTSGTPGYMAPEVITGNNHCQVIDYFAMGVIGFEIMMGERPYKGKSRKEIKDQMIMNQAEIKEENIPIGWSVEASNFFNRLLIREPENRLGFKGINEIKRDEWFSTINFKELYKKKIRSPYKSFTEENFDKNYCIYEEKESLMTIERYKEIMNSNIYEKMFINYTYYPLVDNEKNKIYINKKIIKSNGKNSKKSSPNKNVLFKNKITKNNKYLFKEIFHARHISNDIEIVSDPNSFIPLSNRKKEIRLNRIHKNFIHDFRLTNKDSDNYLKHYLNFSKSKREKNKNFLHLMNIREKKSRSISLNNKTINNRSLDKSKRTNIEKIIRKEKTAKQIMKKIKLKLAKNIINNHIKSNNLINHEKFNTNSNLDINKNRNISGNYFKLINNNYINNNRINKMIYKQLNSPKAIKSPISANGINYIYSAKKPNKKTILNQFNLSNLCGLNFNINNNNKIVTINICAKNKNINKNNINTQNNIVHYHKINKTITKLNNVKKITKQKEIKNSHKKERNKIENIIHNIYTNISIKNTVNSPIKKKINIPLDNSSQMIPQDMNGNILKKNAHHKNSDYRPNKLVKKCPESVVKSKNKKKKIKLSSIRNLDIGNYLTKKNSRNKILQLSKLNNLYNKRNEKIKNKKKTLREKKLEFKLSIPSFPQIHLYNQFLTNQTVNITVSNCFNNSTINEKKEIIERVNPIHRRYASINYPITYNYYINNKYNHRNYRIKKNKSKIPK